MGEKSKLLAKPWLPTLIWACVSSNGVDLLRSYYWKSSMLGSGARHLLWGCGSLSENFVMSRKCKMVSLLRSYYSFISKRRGDDDHESTVLLSLPRSL